jgi:hypothetical protein
MRRAPPERGENSGPGMDFSESLTSCPELENSQGHHEMAAHHAHTAHAHMLHATHHASEAAKAHALAA